MNDPLDITVLLSGAAGQGIQTVGSVLAKAASKSGYAVFSWQEYESRIRGGANSYRIRISDHVRNAPTGKADLFMPMDKKSKEKYFPLLEPDGIRIDEAEEDDRTLAVPFANLAKERFGEPLFANSIACGIASRVLGMNLAIVKAVLTEELASKPEDIQKKNIGAAEIGYRETEARCAQKCHWRFVKREKRYHLLSGNEALAVGAWAAGCRFIAAYPMTPSTGIITWFSKYRKECQVFAEQAEDEIAAIHMAVGASYAGVRAMTATSGGGFALMTEGLSLSGMTETPVVVVLGQRPAPATGLPTRTEQGDLLFAVHAGHGYFPKLVLAPSDPKNAFHAIIRAFTLAEKYQIPAVVLTDQSLAESNFSIEDFETDTIRNETFLADPRKISDYKRYAWTPTGISPRLHPGQSRHLVCCDSDEHDEYGHITEDLSVRNRMVEKRLKKADLLKAEIRKPEEYLSADAKTVLFSWGSSRNAVREAVDRMRIDGKKIGFVHFSEMWPLPQYRLPRGVKKVTVESNADGLFRQLLQLEYGMSMEGSILRYDGLPLDAAYVMKECLHVDR